MRSCAKASSISFAVAILAGCARTPAALGPAAAAVQLSEAAPPSGYVEVAKISVKSGEGCGILGKDGSREDAERLLRLKAVELNASFVRITEVRGPRPNHSCLEHEHVLSGIAYRGAPEPPPHVSPAASDVAVTPSGPPPALPPRASALTLLDYEGNQALGRPAPESSNASVRLSLVPGESAGSALGVTFTCAGEASLDSLRVWNEARVTDWRAAAGLTFRVKPDAALALSVSFLDGHASRYTQRTDALVAGSWQTVTLPLDKFTHDADGPAGDRPGAPLDAAHVAGFAFGPAACSSGQFTVDDFKLVADLR